MEDNSSKHNLEDEVIKFYVDNVTKLVGKETNALISWASLNTAEKELIFQKYYDNKAEKANIANYFKSTLSKNNHNINNELATYDQGGTKEVDYEYSHSNETINCIEENGHSQIIEENNCYFEPHSEAEITLAPICNKLPKPSRPAVKSASELFEMFKLPDQSWRSLTPPQQRFYYNALRTIKRNYIDTYHKYLCSLSTEELYLLHQDTFEGN